jgi:soluble lytic murein transglycosylase-like protein
MGPTVHDVRGAPIPGLSGSAPRVRPAAAPFREVLATTLAAPRAAARARPAAAPVRTAPLRLAPSRAAVEVGESARQGLAASIRRASAEAGVAPDLSVAIARAESNVDPHARSSDGLSVGTFQMTKATEAEMRRKIAAGRVERPSGNDDVALGVGYLRYLHDLIGRNARLAPGLSTVPVEHAAERRLFAIAAFNAGEGRVAGAQAKAAASGGDPTRYADVRPFLPRITRGYVDRVVGYI